MAGPRVGCSACQGFSGVVATGGEYSYLGITSDLAMATGGEYSRLGITSDLTCVNLHQVGDQHIVNWVNPKLRNLFWAKVYVAQAVPQLTIQH